MSTDPLPADSPTRAGDTELTFIDHTLADLLADGAYMVDACSALGLNRRMVYKRLARDQNFADAMNEAVKIGYEVRQAKLDRIAAGDLEAGSTGDWKRDQLICKQGNWALERLHPGRYGPKIEIETKNRTLTAPMSTDSVEAARQYTELMQGGG